jgi:hypothetical protein
VQSKADLGIIILTNLESINPTPISYQILDILLPNKETKKSNLKKKKIKTKAFNSIVGD